mmetsp:Transcript_86065/g.240640  ORF Transcript_86065/g.240640 Transcript_86065/m.240640 type:complete len:238 (+) Transcript_86065:859-1572(+)
MPRRASAGNHSLFSISAQSSSGNASSFTNTRPQVKTSPERDMATVWSLPQAAFVKRTLRMDFKGVGQCNSTETPPSRRMPAARASPIAQAPPQTSSINMCRTPHATDAIWSGPPPCGGIFEGMCHGNEPAPVSPSETRCSTTGTLKTAIVGAMSSVMRSMMYICFRCGTASSRSSQACPRQSAPFAARRMVPVHCEETAARPAEPQAPKKKKTRVARSSSIADSPETTSPLLRRTPL